MAKTGEISRFPCAHGHGNRPPLSTILEGKPTERTRMGDHMGFLKFVAVAALAVVPFIFVKEERDDEVSPEGRIVDSDEIFELELNG